MTQPAILETELAPYFTTKAPFQFPPEFREGFVKYWPIVSLVLLLLALPAILGLFGLGALVGSAGGVSLGIIYTIGVVFSLITTVLGALALPGLFNRKRQGWVLSYYAQLISVVGSLVSFNILGILLGLVFLMLLFQVREYYH
ncbi:MAG: chromate transporter [Bacteroidetes bacterium]|nr:chromate transporter [Fibrella sp.]